MVSSTMVIRRSAMLSSAAASGFAFSPSLMPRNSSMRYGWAMPSETKISMSSASPDDSTARLSGDSLESATCSIIMLRASIFSLSAQLPMIFPKQMSGLSSSPLAAKLIVFAAFTGSCIVSCGMSSSLSYPARYSSIFARVVSSGMSPSR